MIKSISTDMQMLQNLRTVGEVRDNALKEIYQNQNLRTIVNDAIVNAGGKEEDYLDVFETCIIRLDQLARRSSKLEKSVEVFFLETCKLVWSQTLQSNESLLSSVLDQLSRDGKLERQIHAHIQKHGGSLQDAEDCYQNGMIKIVSLIQDGKYDGGSIGSYLYQLCFNLWRNERRKSKPDSTDDFVLESVSTHKDPHRLLEEKESADVLDRIFELLSDTCRKILRLKYFVVDQYSMDQIAEIMQLKGGHIASNTLSKCRKKLMELVNMQQVE